MGILLPMIDTGFGARLRLVREAAGLTQQQVAERMDPPMKRTNYITLETGKTKNPTQETKRRLAHALGLSEAEFAKRIREAIRADGFVPGSIEDDLDAMFTRALTTWTDRQKHLLRLFIEAVNVACA